MLGKRKSGQNYLEQIPERNPKLTWKEDESGIVILDMVHQGLFDKIAQGLFATPKVSHIRLEAFGSFIWKQIDERLSAGGGFRRIRRPRCFSGLWGPERDVTSADVFGCLLKLSGNFTIIQG